MTVVVLVPRRSDDGGYRDRAWDWLALRWRHEHPDWTVVEGHHVQGPFNRAKAINQAARSAGDWDTAVIADADTFTDPDQLRAAVDVAANGRITFAFDQYCYLSRDGSQAIQDGFRGSWEPFVEWTMAGTCSSMVVVNRRLWDEAGGFDEGFIGWGFEDIQFSISCQTYGGGTNRIPGRVWHLWHPPSNENNHRLPNWRKALARMKRYEAVDYDPDRLRALQDELGCRQ